MSPQGKTLFISGASRGIGLAIGPRTGVATAAIRFALAGENVTPPGVKIA